MADAELIPLGQPDDWYGFGPQEELPDTWGKFKRAVERLGVKDEDELRFIDWSSGNSPRLFETLEKDGWVSIT